MQPPVIDVTGKGNQQEATTCMKPPSPPELPDTEKGLKRKPAATNGTLKPAKTRQKKGKGGEDVVALKDESGVDSDSGKASDK